MITKDTTIISMTSWTPRIDAVPNAYKAVLRQIEEDMDVHCVLVLCTEEFPNKEVDLPQEVLGLGVEILWTDRNTRSHKKLMPTLRKYPDNPIIVIDDDTCQVDGWLKTFIEDHKKYPNDIIFGQSTSVCHVGVDGRICEVRNGKCYEHAGQIAYTQKPASGASGTLFPPHVFTREEFYDEDLMMELSPTCDETWQWAFALMEGRTIRALSKCNLPTINPCNQDCSLIHTNRHEINNIHAAIAQRFPEYKEELKRRQGCLIVAMYSHDERLAHVHHTIGSLYNQSVRPTKVVLHIPQGQEGLLSNDVSPYIQCGFLEIFYIEEEYGMNNKYVYAMLRNAGAAVLVVEDNCLYPYNAVNDLWIRYLENPCNVYAGETKYIALGANNQPMSYEEWGKHGRLYKDFEGYRDQVAQASGGVLLPPSTIASTFNKDALIKYANAGNTLLHCAIIASGLNVAKVSLNVGRHSNLEDEKDAPFNVNELIKEYRVI